MERTVFDALWDSSLKEKLASLEELRKKERRAIIVGVVTAVAVCIALILLVGFENEAPLMFAGVAGFCVYMALRPKRYRHLYKEKVITALTSATTYAWQMQSAIVSRDGFGDVVQRFAGWNSLAGARFRDVFIDSGLYRKSVTSFVADDIFASGTYPIAAIEARAVHGAGKHKRTIFDGLLFRFNTGHSFAGETYIRSERSGISGIGIGSDAAHALVRGGMKETRLEWGDFEDLLEVHTTNEVEAREILDPQFMEVLYAWWQEHGEKHGVRMSFKGTYVFLAVPFGYNLFEPRPFSSVEEHKDELWHYLGAFLLAENLFDHLRHKYRLDLATAHLKETIPFGVR